MTESTTEDPSGAVRFRKSFAIDSKFAGRVTLAAFQVLIFRRIWPMLFISLMFAVIALISFSGGGVATAVGISVLVLFALPALYALVFLIAFFPTRRNTRFRLPVGSEYAIDVRPDSMRLKDPMVETDISYNLYKSLRVTKHLIVFMPRQGRLPTLLPRELFTAESLSWIESRLRGIQ